ncbi:hypothetical protein LZ31DRAFT_120375 [Colletotrichum somersetense]|nr:hypothetical protein LZ31DRAFT_120375 [Colletotrichum somersetense]
MYVYGYIPTYPYCLYAALLVCSTTLPVATVSCLVDTVSLAVGRSAFPRQFQVSHLPHSADFLPLLHYRYLFFSPVPALVYRPTRILAHILSRHATTADLARHLNRGWRSRDARPPFL